MEIGPKPFIIAELSGNWAHTKDPLQTMLDMIKAAKESGCDAVKIQAYEPADLCDPLHMSIYEQCKIKRHWYATLFAVAKDLGIPLFASVFAPWAIEFLKQLDCPAYKLASPESTRLPPETYAHLRRLIWESGKTFIASSGQADMNSVTSLCPDVLMYCVAGYPAILGDYDFQFFSEMSQLITHKGFSDHTKHIEGSLAMIGAGASVIEKHFKLDDDCIDAAFSLNPTQMELLCRLAHR